MNTQALTEREKFEAKQALWNWSRNNDAAIEYSVDVQDAFGRRYLNIFLAGAAWAIQSLAGVDVKREVLIDRLIGYSKSADALDNESNIENWAKGLLEIANALTPAAINNALAKIKEGSNINHNHKPSGMSVPSTDSGASPDLGTEVP